MTNQEILTKAVHKAVDNGFYSFADGMFGHPEFVISGGANPTQDLMRGGFKIQLKGWPAEETVSIERLLFDYDFAKALWGESTDTLIVQNNSLNVKQVVDMNGWQYHLQQMVVADDPITYLGDHLND